MSYARQPSIPGTCRHCQQDRTEARWRRGLCRKCYGDPTIRARYGQRGSLKGLAGVNKQHRDADLRSIPPDPEPTTAWPGTEAKILLLTERASLGQALFHRLDPACFDASRFAELNRPAPLPSTEPKPLYLVDPQDQLLIAELYATLPGRKAVAALAASLKLDPAELLRGHVFLTEEEE